MQKGKEETTRCRCLTREGRRVVLSVSTSLIRDAAGRVETAVAVIQDLTEREALEADLRRWDRLAAMGELAAGVAHEVRNPMVSVKTLNAVLPAMSPMSLSSISNRVSGRSMP